MKCYTHHLPLAFTQLVAVKRLEAALPVRLLIKEDVRRGLLNLSTERDMWWVTYAALVLLCWKSEVQGTPCPTGRGRLCSQRSREMFPLKQWQGCMLPWQCCYDLDCTPPLQQAVGAELGGRGQHHSSRSVETSGRVIAHGSLTSPCALRGNVQIKSSCPERRWLCVVWINICPERAALKYVSL